MGAVNGVEGRAAGRPRNRRRRAMTCDHERRDGAHALPHARDRRAFVDGVVRRVSGYRLGCSCVVLRHRRDGSILGIVLSDGFRRRARLWRCAACYARTVAMEIKMILALARA